MPLREYWLYCRRVVGPYYRRVLREAWSEAVKWFGKILVVRTGVLVITSFVLWLVVDKWVMRLSEQLLYPLAGLVGFFLVVFIVQVVLRPVAIHAEDEATIEALRREFPPVEIQWGSLPRAFLVPKRSESESARRRRFIVINNVVAVSRSSSPVSVRLRLTLLLPRGEHLYFEAQPSGLKPWETERERLGEADTDPLPSPVDLAGPGSRSGYVAFVIDGTLEMLLDVQAEPPFELLTWGLHVEDLIGRTSRQITAFGIELKDLVEQSGAE